jgi:hypothetical protein
MVSALDQNLADSMRSIERGLWLVRRHNFWGRR